MEKGTYKLNGALECRDAIAAAAAHDPVNIDRTPTELRFLNASGHLLGTLSSRHGLAKRLASGATLLHCSACSVYGRCDMRPNGSISVHVAIGAPDETYERWRGREPSAARAYPIGLVGEAHYQNAISGLHEGEAVTLSVERGNPHDERAIVAKTVAGATIGYLPRDSWLQAVVHDDQCGVDASVKFLRAGATIKVVLDAIVTGEPLGEAVYEPR